MAPSWRWLLAAVAAVALSLLAPGSMLTSPAPVSGRWTSIEAVVPVPVPAASECAAVSCNRGSPTTMGGVPTVAAAGVLVVAALALPLRRIWRRAKATILALPAGSPFALLRPPQSALGA